MRAAKGSGASKDEVQGLVKELLKLKTDYKTLTGNDPPGAAPQQSCKYIFQSECFHLVLLASSILMKILYTIAISNLVIFVNI